MKKHKLLAFAAGMMLAGWSQAYAQPSNTLAHTAEGMIASFSLIDVATGEELLELSYPGNDPVINLADYPGITLQLRVNVGPSDYRGTVQFSLNGVVFNTDSTAPFLLDALPGSAQFPVHNTYSCCAATDDPSDEGCITFHLVDVEWGLTHLTLVSATGNYDVVNFLAETLDTPFDPNRYRILDLTYLDQPQHISIRANTRPERVVTVGFGLNGDDYGWEEKLPPYSLFGDDNGQYRSWEEVHKRNIGGSCNSARHYLAIFVQDSLRSAMYDTQYSFQTGGRNESDPHLQSATYYTQFSFRYDRAATGFVLVDALNDAELGPLNDGDTLFLSELPTRQLNIRTLTQPYWSPLVQVELQEQMDGGTRFRRRFERTPPYSIFGDIGGDYVVWYARPGTYTLTAMPRPNESQEVILCGIPYTITFTVLESPAERIAALSNTLKATLWPNPAPSEAWIRFEPEQSCISSLELFDMQGKRLLHRVEQTDGQMQNWRIQTQNLPAGMYRVILHADNARSVFSLAVP